MLPQGGVGWPYWIAERVWALFMFEQTKSFPSVNVAILEPKNSHAAIAAPPLVSSIALRRYSAVMA
jgi:hypothetical protein